MDRKSNSYLWFRSRRFWEELLKSLSCQLEGACVVALDGQQISSSLFIKIKYLLVETLRERFCRYRWTVIKPETSHYLYDTRGELHNRVFFTILFFGTKLADPKNLPWLTCTKSWSHVITWRTRVRSACKVQAKCAWPLSVIILNSRIRLPTKTAQLNHLQHEIHLRATELFIFEKITSNSCSLSTMSRLESWQRLVSNTCRFTGSTICIFLAVGFKARFQN